jgi:hypothetical protein
MILVRNIFRLKFGQAREATATWKEGLAIAKRAALPIGSARLLTDLAGPDFYTLIVESAYDSLADFERAAQTVMGNAEWRAWYPKVVALCEGGRREILNVVE